MLNMTGQETSLVRLEALLQSRYGKGLVLKHMIDLEKVRQVDCWGGEFALIGGDLHIPLRMNDNVLGTAVIPKATDLSSRSQGDIAELVKLVLEPQLYNKHLETKFVNLEQLLSDENRLAEALNGESFFNKGSFEVIETAETEDHNELLNPLIHLYTKNSELLLKVAHTIHEITGHWAFLPFSDIADEIKEVEDLEQMGLITVLIKDIESVPMVQQKIIAKYLASQSSKERPLLLVGSSLGTDDILQSRQIEESLKQDLLGCCIDIERLPLANHRLVEVLELMLVKSL